MSPTFEPRNSGGSFLQDHSMYKLHNSYRVYQSYNLSIDLSQYLYSLPKICINHILPYSVNFSLGRIFCWNLKRKLWLLINFLIFASICPLLVVPGKIIGNGFEEVLKLLETPQNKLEYLCWGTSRIPIVLKNMDKPVDFILFISLHSQ